LSPGTSSIGLNTPRLAGGTLCHLGEVAGAILLILGHSSRIYIAAIAIPMLFAFLISGVATDRHLQSPNEVSRLSREAGNSPIAV